MERVISLNVDWRQVNIVLFLHVVVLNAVYHGTNGVLLRQAVARFYLQGQFLSSRRTRHAMNNYGDRHVLRKTINLN